MQHSKYPLILFLTLAAFFVPGRAAVSQVPTAPTTTIRIASLAPPGSSFVKVLKAWSRTLEKETEGRIELRVFPGVARAATVISSSGSKLASSTQPVLQRRG